MPSSPPSRSLSPDLPFKFVGGDPSLDLVNTVDWTPAGLEYDRLASYERLLSWARGAGVLSDSQGQALRTAAARNPDQARRAYEAARWTRWVLHELFQAVISRQPLSGPLRPFRRLLAYTQEHLELSARPAGRRRGSAALAWSWRSTPDQLESILWPVVHAAAKLLTSPDAAQLRMCAGPDCGWLYVDRSRNGLRRWCQMRTCGTQSKSRRRAARRSAERRRTRRARNV
jgi:predicted RNA-binding Zn ribbon-like protein